MNITITSDKEKQLKETLQSKTDFQSQRIRRYLKMPDLSRTPGSPIYELAQRITNLHEFKNFDIIEVPEIVPADISFDLFDFPPDHPVRSPSDTYYIDPQNILRTHTTVMWYYYLMNEDIKKRIAAGEAVGSLCYGKVFRKDEIDRRHMNIFHQMDGWYLCRKDEKIITTTDLQNVLAKNRASGFRSRHKIPFQRG